MVERPQDLDRVLLAKTSAYCAAYIAYRAIKDERLADPCTVKTADEPEVNYGGVDPCWMQAKKAEEALDDWLEVEGCDACNRNLLRIREQADLGRARGVALRSMLSTFKKMQEVSDGQ